MNKITEKMQKKITVKGGFYPLHQDPMVFNWGRKTNATSGAVSGVIPPINFKRSLEKTEGEMVMHLSTPLVH